MPRATTPKAPAPLRCSFCHRTEDDVAYMVRGPTENICDTCIDLCHEIVTKARERRKAEVPA